MNGFTTQNDLDRHQKTLHAVTVGKSYRCAAEHCPKKGKLWPRADNFRQHCQRLHPDLDTSGLMSRSLLPEPGITSDTTPIEGPMPDFENPATRPISETFGLNAFTAISSPTAPMAPERQADRETPEASEQALVTTASPPRPRNHALDDDNDGSSTQRTRTTALHSKRNTHYRLQTSPTAQTQEEAILSDTKPKIIETSNSGVAKIPWDAAPALANPTQASNNHSPPITSYHVYPNCTDPATHFVRTSREGSPRRNGPKGPHERFIVTAGSCPICR